jgi:hypothetical protein
MGPQVLADPSSQWELGMTLMGCGLFLTIAGALCWKYCDRVIKWNNDFLKIFISDKHILRLLDVDVAVARPGYGLILVIGLVISGIGVYQLLQPGRPTSRHEVVPANSVETKEAGGSKDRNRVLLFAFWREPAGSVG